MVVILARDAERWPMSVQGQSLQIVARQKPLYVCNAPDSDQILPRSEMPRWATTGLGIAVG
jgi:hypothetical protein